MRLILNSSCNELEFTSNRYIERAEPIYLKYKIGGGNELASMI